VARDARGARAEPALPRAPGVEYDVDVHAFAPTLVLIPFYPHARKVEAESGTERSFVRAWTAD
jgi:hypothetical protein